MAISFQAEWNDFIPFQPELNELSIPTELSIPIWLDWRATLLIILRNMPPGVSKGPFLVFLGIEQNRSFSELLGGSNIWLDWCVYLKTNCFILRLLFELDPVGYDS